jgi:drug/metabolite transporter (DMT)-like permease
MPWLYLTLFSAFSLATADAVTKRYLSHYPAGELVLVRFGVTAILLLPLLLIQPWPAMPAPFWGWVAALLPFEILAMWLYMKAIRQSPLTLTLPYLAFTPVFNTVTGYLLLGETVTLQGFSGIALVVCGAWLLNIDAMNNGSRLAVLAPFRAIASEQGSRLMLIVAALYSLTSVMGKGALQYVPAAFFGPFYFVLLGVVASIVFARRDEKPWQVLIRHPWAHLGVGLFMGLMVLTHFLAIQHVEVAYMIAVKRTSLLFGILYGAWLFREHGLGRNLLAGMIMVAGVYLIAG